MLQLIPTLNLPERPLLFSVFLQETLPGPDNLSGHLHLTHIYISVPEGLFQNLGTGQPLTVPTPV